MDEKEWRQNNWDKTVNSDTSFQEEMAELSDKITARNKRYDAIMWLAIGLLLGLSIGSIF